MGTNTPQEMEDQARELLAISNKHLDNGFKAEALHCERSAAMWMTTSNICERLDRTNELLSKLLAKLEPTG